MKAFILAVAVAMAGFTGTAMAQDLDGSASFEEMAYGAGDVDNAESSSLLRSPWPGRGGGAAWRDRVQCKSVNQRGVVFYGRGRNMPEARDAALRKCRQVSRRCTLDGCRPI